MKALVYHGPGQKAGAEVDRAGIRDDTDVIVRVDDMRICGTDLHVLKGDVPAVTGGRILGHEAVGTVEAVGAAVKTVRSGDRVLVFCITACGSCRFCRRRRYGQCLGGGGWILGHKIDLTQAEFVRVPFADTPTYPAPAGVTDEQLLMAADIDELRLRNAELDALGRVDALTGLFNRRHGQEALDRAVSLARRHDLPLSVLMIDIDHFKAVNDQYGHPGGDAVLRELAARLCAVLRAEDVATRWGGDEFLVILPATELCGALVLAERARRLMRAEPFVLDDDRRCQTTLSIGCAAYVGDEPQDLVCRADQALYEAKQSGRDRVIATS